MMKGIREAAALSLGVLDDISAMMPLLDLLDDEKDSVRYGAVLALSSLADKTALKQLRLAAEDDIGWLDKLQNLQSKKLI